MISIMYEEQIETTLKQVALSNNTISRRIDDIANDRKCQHMEGVKKCKFTIELDESTDVSNLAQLLVFV